MIDENIKEIQKKQKSRSAYYLFVKLINLAQNYTLIAHYVYNYFPMILFGIFGLDTCN